MLLEHKLHATRLQSEVSLLTQEKVAAEESVEALLEEISEFEQGVAQLEKEMHQLSKIEAEAVGVLDEEAKYELREQKMRLDREFGAMLAKIAERREKLGGLEGKLATLDHARQGKEPRINQILAARLATAGSWPPRHRRDTCSTAWRCWFLTARRSQHGRVLVEVKNYWCPRLTG